MLKDMIKIKDKIKIKDMIKDMITNAWNVMMLINQVGLLHSWMQIIYMVGQWVNIWPIVNLNG